MTIILYADNKLYTDSKKLDYIQSAKAVVAIQGQKIRLIADGAIAYATCGTDVHTGERDVLENHIKSLMFSSWLSREFMRNTKDEVLKKAIGIWLNKYEREFAEPMDPVVLIAMTKENVLSIEYSGHRTGAKGGCTYLDITDDDGHVLAASPAAYHIYKRCGMSTMSALKKVIESSGVCDLPIQMQPRESLTDPNYRDFAKHIIAKAEAEEAAKDSDD